MFDPKLRDNLGFIIGILGFIISIYSFVVDGLQGNTANILALRALGILGLFSWMVWVSRSLVNLKKSSNQVGLSKITGYPGYAVKHVRFDGRNRNILNELNFIPADDAKGTDLEKQPLGKVVAEGTKLKIWREHSRFRWIAKIIRYENTSAASTDRYIPAEIDPNLQGDPSRFIYFRFDAHVIGDAQKILVRMRGADGSWMKRQDGLNQDASREVRVTRRTFETFEGIIGPILVDRRCYVSLDIMPGPTGEKNGLYLQNLEIIELRKSIPQSHPVS